MIGVLTATLWVFLVVPTLIISLMNSINKVSGGKASFAPGCDYSVALLWLVILVHLVVVAFMVFWFSKGCCKPCKRKRMSRAAVSSLCVIMLLYAATVAGFSASVLVFTNESSADDVRNATDMGVGSGADGGGSGGMVSGNGSGYSVINASGDGATSNSSDGVTSASSDGVASASGDSVTSASGDSVTSANGDVVTSASGDGLTSAGNNGVTSGSGDYVASGIGDDATSGIGDGVTSASEESKGDNGGCGAIEDGSAGFSENGELVHENLTKCTNETTLDQKKAGVCVAVSSEAFVLAVVFPSLLIVLLAAVLCSIVCECSHRGFCYQRTLYDPTVTVFENETSLLGGLP